MRELSVLINDGNDRRMARAAGELGAAVESMESATQKILASAEAVDDCARALASAGQRGPAHPGRGRDGNRRLMLRYRCRQTGIFMVRAACGWRFGKSCACNAKYFAGH
jgi:hypothetical protein